jgi:hypothetical protein
MIKEYGGVDIRQRYVLSLSVIHFYSLFLAFLGHRSFVLVLSFVHSFPNALWTFSYSISCRSPS